MRKLAVAVMAMLVPFAAWTAGCRRDSNQAAFPRGPEVKGLAQASTVEDVRPTVPMVPEPIDPEVLQSPDQLTFARIRSVQDREERLAGRYGDATGLFVLPAEENGLAYLDGPAMTPFSPAASMGAPVYEPLRVIPIGSPDEEPLPEPIPMSALASAPASAPMTEFWSRPVTPMTSAYGFMPPPVDVSAMAPPAAVIPLPAAAPAPAPVPDLNAESMLLPEPIPGIFTGGDVGPTAFAAPKTILEQAGDVNPPPAFFTASAAGASAEKPPLETTGLTVEEPMMPPAAAVLAALPFRPETTFSDKVTALLQNADPKTALSPLAPLGGEKTESKAKPKAFGNVEPVALNEPPPALFEMEADLSPESLAFGPLNEAVPVMPPGIEVHDVYRLDYWDSRRAPGTGLETFAFDPAGSAANPVSEKEQRTEKEDAPVLDPLESFANWTPSLSAMEKSDGGNAMTALPETDAPQKVTLAPARPIPSRIPGLEKIDSSVEAPPLRF